MRFEFDPSKSASNLAKHGIDFEAVQAAWADPRHLEVPARTAGEARWALIGRIGARHWTVIFTRRGDRLRIISARRARQEEVALYGTPDHR
jgi:uncharacterized protein